MAAIVEVKYFNTFILKKTLSNLSPGEQPMWNGSRGIPSSIGGYPRSSPQAPDNDDIGNWSIEESRIRGGYNNTNVDYGVKAYLVEDEPNSSNRINTLIYSGIFNSRTGINNTNVFSVGADITKSADPANGSIQKLYAEDTNLNIFQELKVSRALIDKDAIYSAEGGGSVTSSSLVIGVIQPYNGRYGISTNPESFAVYGYNKYFSDSNKNAILRLSRSGIDEISSYGMKDYFRDEVNSIKVASAPGVIIGGWDVYTSQYIVSTQKNITLQSESYNTLSFDEKINGWTSFYSYKPDQIFSIRNQMYTTKDGSLWLHNSSESILAQASVNGSFVGVSVFQIDNVQGDIQVGDLVTGAGVLEGSTVLSINGSTLTLSKIQFNINDNTQLLFNSSLRSKFYNVNSNSSVTFVFNDRPGSSKTFNTINYEGTSGWQVESFLSDNTGEDLADGQFAFTNDSTNSVFSYLEGSYDTSGASYPSLLNGEVFRAGFDRKENKYVANLINNSAGTNGEVHFGSEVSGIKGFYSTVKMSTDLSTDFGGEKQLFQVGSSYTINNGY